MGVFASISHFPSQSQSEETIVTIVTPVQKTPKNKASSGWRRGLTMGVTAAWDRHPAAEGGPGASGVSAHLVAVWSPRGDGGDAPLSQRHPVRHPVSPLRRIDLGRRVTVVTLPGGIL